MAKKSTNTNGSKAATKTKAVKATTFNPAHKIHLLVKENPKRAKSKEAKRFSLYKNGMTVAQAFELGMNPLNLRIDTEREYIKVGA